MFLGYCKKIKKKWIKITFFVVKNYIIHWFINLNAFFLQGLIFLCEIEFLRWWKCDFNFQKIKKKKIQQNFIWKKESNEEKRRKIKKKNLISCKLIFQNFFIVIFVFFFKNFSGYNFSRIFHWTFHTINWEDQFIFPKFFLIK